MWGYPNWRPEMDPTRLTNRHQLKSTQVLQKDSKCVKTYSVMKTKVSIFNQKIDAESFSSAVLLSERHTSSHKILHWPHSSLNTFSPKESFQHSNVQLQSRSMLHVVITTWPHYYLLILLISNCSSYDMISWNLQNRNDVAVYDFVCNKKNVKEAPTSAIALKLRKEEAHLHWTRKQQGVTRGSCGQLPQTSKTSAWLLLRPHGCSQHIGWSSPPAGRASLSPDAPGWPLEPFGRTAAPWFPQAVQTPSLIEPYPWLPGNEECLPQDAAKRVDTNFSGKLQNCVSCISKRYRISKIVWEAPEIL